jgi:uncharacterized protein
VKTLALLAALLLSLPARAALHFPPAPPGGQYVVDLASIISPSDKKEIQELAERLWADQQTQLVVVTIDSMAQYGGARMNIEDFAARLFQEWGIGASVAQHSYESMGILLLVSRLDRKARIELGPGWGQEKDSACWSLMQDHLVPAFKREQHSSALAFGASALDRMARGQGMPRAPLTQEHMLGYAGGGVLGLFTLISLLRSGTRGYAWSFWSVVFSVLWTILGVVFTLLLSPRRHHHHHHGWGSSHSHSSRSSWSSGGGGSSRGGGATGSW